MNWEVKIQELQIAMNTEKERRMFEGYQAIKLVFEGKTQKETAAIIGRTEQTLGSYVVAYTKNRLAAGLYCGTFIGRTPRLTEAQR